MKYFFKHDYIQFAQIGYNVSPLILDPKTAKREFQESDFEIIRRISK